MTTAPDEREDKPAWRLVPPRLKAAVEGVIGSPVVRGVRVYGGYGPSATYALRHADGSRTFFKGTYPLSDSSGVRWALDREETVYRRLGSYIRPWAPQYLGSVRADGWHGVLLEWVDGTPALPWTPGKAMTAARSFASFHASTLGRPLPQWLSRTQHLDFAAYWGHLGDDDGAIRRLAALAGAQSTQAIEWLRGNLETLQRAERALSRAPEPCALLHFDTRSDNVRLETEMLRVFDWRSASDTASPAAMRGHGCTRSACAWRSTSCVAGGGSPLSIRELSPRGRWKPIPTSGSPSMKSSRRIAPLCC